MRFLRNLSAIVFFIFCINTLTAQINLFPIGAGPSPTCTTIEVGSTLNFTRNVSGPNPICDNNINFSNLDISPVIDSSFAANSFSWTFEELGTYNIFCGAPGALAGGQANVCYTVVPVRSIPTLSQWGMAIFILLLIISGIIALKLNQLKATTIS